MRQFALALTIYTAMFSTQPAWEPMIRFFSGGECGAVCEVLSYCQPQDENSSENPSCCPPFSCCFLFFPETILVQQLHFQLPESNKIRPAENTDILQTQYCSDCFHPPEMA